MWLGLITLFVITPIHAMLRGWVLSLLWQWFIVPVFALPPLGVGTGLGVALIISYLTAHPHPSNDDKKSDEEKLGALMGPILYDFASLGLGLVVHLLIS